VRISKVSVIGAGPMGLAAAYHLAKSGISVTVYEANDSPGGMSESFDFDGTLIEKYYHFINMPDSSLFGLLKELGMDEDVRWSVTRMGLFRPSIRNQSEGELHAWGNPVAIMRFGGVSLLTRIRYGLHALHCRRLKDLMSIDDLSASEWITQWIGREGYDVLWRFLFEKKFFELADPLSAAWIASRARRVAKSRKNMMQEQLGYLEGGSASLIERLRDEIVQRGGEVRLSSGVREVQPLAPFRFSVKTDRTAEEYDGVISTIPLPYVSGMIKDLPEDYRSRIACIQNVGVICVLFRLAKKLTENFWLNTDMPGWDIPGIIEYSNLRPMDKAYVYIPFYMPRTHPNWKASNAEILEKARSYIASVNPDAAKTEEAAAVFRYEYAQPVCPPGFRKVLPGYRTGIDGLLVADTTHSFPEDRSIQESVRIAKEMVEIIAGYE